MNSVKKKVNSKVHKNQAQNVEVEQLVLPLSRIKGKKLEVNFQGGALSSDGGILLLREVEKQIGIIQDIAACICDNRDQRYVKQSVMDMLRQRCYQIAAGWEDGDDCDSLRDDPIYKMASERRPIKEEPLASQPTISRFENSLTRKELYRIGEVFVEKFLSSYSRAPKVVVLDFDETVDPVHGGQQLSLFNAFYGEYCYCPLHVYEGLSGKLITTLLKSGKQITSKQIFGILRRLVKRLRREWPDTIILFRGDSYYSSRSIRNWIAEQEKVYYITRLKSHKVLRQRCQLIRERAKRLYAEINRPVKLYHSFYYQAATWSKAHRVIAVIKRDQTGEEMHFVVTNLYKAKARVLYEQVYCGRGNMENMIKEHKRYLKSDRTSCHRFLANQFRLFLHSAAYVLLHALRDNLLKHTQFGKASFDTIRLKLLKIGAQVHELKTCIKIQLPYAYPHKDILEKCCGIFTLIGAT